MTRTRSATTSMKLVIILLILAAVNLVYVSQRGEAIATWRPLLDSGSAPVVRAVAEGWVPAVSAIMASYLGIALAGRLARPTAATT